MGSLEAKEVVHLKNVSFRYAGALRKAEQMAIALEVRGFNSGQRRTSYGRVSWHLRDIMALVAAGGLMVVYVGFCGSRGMVRLEVALWYHHKKG